MSKQPVSYDAQVKIDFESIRPGEGVLEYLISQGIAEAGVWYAQKEKIIRYFEERGIEFLESDYDMDTDEYIDEITVKAPGMNARCANWTGAIKAAVKYIEDRAAVNLMRGLASDYDIEIIDTDEGGYLVIYKGDRLDAQSLDTSQSVLKHVLYLVQEQES